MQQKRGAERGFFDFRYENLIPSGLSRQPWAALSKTDPSLCTTKTRNPSLELFALRMVPLLAHLVGRLKAFLV